MNPDVVRVGSIAGIAASVPYLLGFQPVESLVVIGLEIDRLVFTMRMDLQAPHLDASLVAEVVSRMANYPEVIVVIYTDEDSRNGLPRRGLVAGLLEELHIREALLVSEGRVWSYLCSVPGCCPSDGLNYNDSKDAVDVAAAHVLSGRQPVANRDQLLATVAGPDRETATAVSSALPTAREAVAELDGDERMAAMTRLLASTLSRLDDPRKRLTTSEVAEYLALLDDVEVRDLFIHRLAATSDPSTRTLVDGLVAQAPSGADAEVAVAKAFLAYLDGNGVIARAAAERALCSHPGHRLAVMLLAALEAGTDPQCIRWLLTM